MFDLLLPSCHNEWMQIFLRVTSVLFGGVVFILNDQFHYIFILESLRNALLESESVSKTERSKSYDEGLENYQEEGRG